MIKKIFTSCKEMYSASVLLWALGLFFATPMLSYWIYFVTTQNRFPMNPARDVFDLCRKYFPDATFCMPHVIDNTMFWVMMMFFLGCAFALTAVFLFLKKKLGLKKFVFILIGVALVAGYYVLPYMLSQLGLVGEVPVDPYQQWQKPFFDPKSGQWIVSQ